MIFVLHLLPRAYSQPIFDPGPCFKDFPTVVASDCSDQVRRLQYNQDAEDSRAWGVEEENTKLPRTLLISDGCSLTIRKSNSFSEPAPSFKLVDYKAEMWDIYASCVIAGECRGGHMSIGPNGGVEAVLWNPPVDWETNVTIGATLGGQVTVGTVEEADTF